MLLDTDGEVVCMVLFLWDCWTRAASTGWVRAVHVLVEVTVVVVVTVVVPATTVFTRVPKVAWAPNDMLRGGTLITGRVTETDVV
jgi:hypothetical protein